MRLCLVPILILLLLVHRLSAQDQSLPLRLDELAAKADKAPTPLAELYRELSRPSDVLTLKSSGPARVVPFADFPGKPRNFEGTWTIPFVDKPAESVSFTREDLSSVHYFETTALAKINRFLTDDAGEHKDLPQRDRLQAGEQLLRAVLVFHEGTRRRVPMASEPWRELK